MSELDVIVVGGGPAGATAAAVLARRGRRVAVIERSHFPRYKVGESLLPGCWHTLERIGALSRVEQAAFQAKYSVQFVSPRGNLSQPFYFDDHVDHPSSRTWQVDRATFDAILLDNAREQGATVFEGTTALEPILEDGAVVGVRVEGPEGERALRAPITIDASGRDGLMSRHLGWRRPETRLDRFALWGYFDGAARDTGRDEGATTIARLPGDGWLWYIPMAHGRVSVGVVARREVFFAETHDPEAAFDEQLGRNPWIADHLAGATRDGPVRVTSDYSYRAEHCADDGLVLVGDAFAFLDPVFSSGVFLALRSAEVAAEAADAALAEGVHTADRFAAYGEWLCGGIEAMRALVHSFYDPDFSMGKMVRTHPELRGDVTDCLMGDLFRDLSALRRALDTFADVPAPLDHGRARHP